MSRDPGSESVDVGLVSTFYERFFREVSRDIVGKGYVIELAATALLSGGHLLLTDVPGVGKTTLAKAVAGACGASGVSRGFSRIQFTPDLLPQDITGSQVYDPSGAGGEDGRFFRWSPGPLFSGVVLADEINRATPRTQSALLEAMAERQITIDGHSHPLPEPFFVIATQNPQSYLGTYELPEGQMDRFSLATSMGYPEKRAETDLVLQEIGRGGAKGRSDVGAAPYPEHDDKEYQGRAGIGERASQGSRGSLGRLDSLLGARAEVSRVGVSREIVSYVVSLARASRQGRFGISLGVSPRGAISLARLAQARAAISGRDFVTPKDVRVLAGDALAHRISLSGPPEEGRSREAVGAVLKSVRSPD